MNRTRRCAIVVSVAALLVGSRPMHADAATVHGRVPASFAFDTQGTRPGSRIAPPRNPVVLVHGIGGGSRMLRRIEEDLRCRGRETHALNLRSRWGGNGLEDPAQQLREFVHEVARGRPVDLVGFSMGGLVCRYYVQRLGGLDRVERLVTIATPHHGTELARLLPNRAGRQMQPGSAFLQDLSRDAAVLRKLEFTTLWTACDLVIIPARSSMMPVGRNERIPALIHPLMVRDRRCLSVVRDALATRGSGRTES